MFRPLYAVARHTALHLIITPNGEQLKIICMPKPAGAGADNSALQKPFSIVGTPEDLETAFPEALAKYTSAVNELRTALDLPLDALEAERKKNAKKEEKKATKEAEEKAAAEKRSAAAKLAAETRAANAEKARKEKEAKDAERQAAKDAKKAAKKGGAPGAPGLPGATSTGTAKPAAWPFPVGENQDQAIETALATVAASATPPSNGLPGKPECLREYYNLRRVHGKKLTRRLFIKKAKTGRRYEKLWDNWEAFVKEADAQLELALEDNTPAGKSAQPGGEQVIYAENRAAAAADSAAKVAPIVAAAPEIELQATDNKSEAAPAASAEEEGSRSSAPTPSPAPETKPVYRVYAKSGELLKESKWPFTRGERIELDGHQFPFVIQDWNPGELEKFRAEASDVVIAGQEGYVFKARKILPMPQRLVTETGAKLGESDEIYLPGEKVAELAQDGDYQVVRVTLDAYVVRDVSTPPPPRWTVYGHDGNEIGSIEFEPVVGDKIDVADLSGLTVVDVEGYDVTAAIVKPRIKGPTATTTPATTPE